MDQGVAALIGAIIGAVGATAAALITVRLSTRGALAQLQQERVQFERQGLADYVRVRRDARRGAYAAFAECFYTFMEIVKRTHETAESGDTRGALALIQGEATVVHGQLLRARSVISIEGPDYVTTAAEAIGDRVHIWMEMRLRIAGISRQSLGASDYASIESGFQTAFREFTEASNRALDNEGAWPDS
ncbi:hypothetical protein AB0N06_09725 [Streptomyces sp. NPDC051020]|uniref:hypothetical protein n=1 Tax=Streptomyces sp. NPDC051020 TaxID=3155409 RepID=UPI003448669A